MILVDSSVWIDYFRGKPAPQTDRFDALLGTTPPAIGDPIMTEVLQGVRCERDFRLVRTTLDAFSQIELGISLAQ